MLKSSDFSKIHFLQTPTEKLAYRCILTDPSLPTLFFIHGNMTSSYIWITMEPLKSKYNLICPDLRGFGHSSYHKPIIALEDYCDDLSELLTFLQIKTVFVIGFSLGGTISLSFCAKYPAIVKGLVLIGSVGIQGYFFKRVDYQGKMIEEKMPDKEFLEEEPITATYIMCLETKNHEFLQILFEKFLFNVGRKVSDEVLKTMIEEALLQKNYLDSLWALNIYNISDSFNGISRGSNEIAKVNCPIILIHGSKDKVIPTKESVETFNAVKSQRKMIKILEGKGHMPQMDDAEMMMEIMDKFFVEVGNWKIKLNGGFL